MSAFASNFQAAFDGAADDVLGEEFTWLPQTGGSSSKTGIVDPVKDAITGQTIKSFLRLRVSATQITLPAAGDKAIIRGLNCVVKEVLAGTGNVWDLKISVGGAAA